MNAQSPLHNCPICGLAMTLKRVTPKLGPHPELLTFRCNACGEVVTVAAGNAPVLAQ